MYYHCTTVLPHWTTFIQGTAGNYPSTSSSNSTRSSSSNIRAVVYGNRSRVDAWKHPQWPFLDLGLSLEKSTFLLHRILSFISRFVSFFVLILSSFYSRTSHLNIKPFVFLVVCTVVYHTQTQSIQILRAYKSHLNGNLN